MINVITLEPGMRVRLVDGATAEVVSNPRDGIWILLQHLTGPDSSEPSNGEELVFAENIVELL